MSKEDKLKKYYSFILKQLKDELDYDFLGQLIYLDHEEFDEYVIERFGAREEDVMYLWDEYIKIVNTMPYYD